MKNNKEEERSMQLVVNIFLNLGILLVFVGFVVALLTPGWMALIVFMLAFVGSALVGLAVAGGISYMALHQDKKYQPKINEKVVYSHKLGKGKSKGFFK